MTSKIRLIYLVVTLIFHIILAALPVFADDGDLMWEFPEEFGNPAVGVDGTIYVKA